MASDEGTYDRAEIDQFVSSFEENRLNRTLSDEDIRQASLGMQYFTSYRFELETTWRTLVTNRNLALEANPPQFDRVLMLGESIKLIAGLIEAGNWPIPDLEQVR